MGLLSDIAKTQVLLVVSPGIIAGEWVVDRVYGDGTTEQLYKSTFLPDVEGWANDKAEELGGSALTIGTEIGIAIKEGLEELGEDLLEGLKSVGTTLANQTLQVIEYAGVAVVDGVDNTYDYIRDKLRGKEPDIIAAVTVGVLSVLAGVYLWNTAKRGAAVNPE